MTTAAPAAPPSLRTWLLAARPKTLTAAGHLVCTWTLARGLDASLDVWYLGIDGYSELNGVTGTAVLG